MLEVKLMTTSEGARRLGVHPKTLSRLMRNKKLPGVKLANRWLIEETVLDEFRKTYTGREGRPKGYSPRRWEKR